MWQWLTNWRVWATAGAISAMLAVALWPDPIAVDVTPARRGRLQVTIDEEGQTRVRERFLVSAPVAGRLERIVLEPGDPVARGKTRLARIMPAPPALLDARTRAELTGAVEAARAVEGQARADRARAAATLARAESSFRRQQELAEAGTISREEFELSQTGLKTAEEGLRAADFSVSRAEYDLQVARARLQEPGSSGRTIEIVAPIDGVVLRRMRESEAVVPAGEPLIEIGNFDQLEVVADLLSTDAVRVPLNARVLIEQWGGGRPLEGRVRRIEPSGFTKVSALGVEEQRVNVIVDFLDRAEAARVLGDSYRVEVRILVWEAPDVLLAPVGVLFRRGDDWAVFVVEEGRARSVVVELGQRGTSDVEVTSGLEAGSRLVLHPPDTLRDGARVAERTGS
jgi:HlyD family secretion protein